MLHRYRPFLATATASVIVFALAACGGGNSSSTESTAASATTPTAGGGTVSVQSISGMGDVLVDAQGNALYTNNKDTGSMLACANACAAIWVPLTAPSSGQPSSDNPAVNGKLGVTQRPDGTSQVTFGGKPLYTFVQDSKGQVTGNGASDSFAGTDFTWTVASAGGATSTAGGASGGGGSTSGSAGATTTTGSSGGGYGY